MEQKYGRYDDEENAEAKRLPLGMNVVLGMIMIAIYLSMAYLLLFTTFFSNLYDIVRYIMGVVFAVYGVFRGYRLFVGMK